MSEWLTPAQVRAKISGYRWIADSYMREGNHAVARQMRNTARGFIALARSMEAA